MKRLFTIALAALLLGTATAAAQTGNNTANGAADSTQVQRPMTQAELETMYRELQAKQAELEQRQNEFQQKIEHETGINVPKKRYINLSYVKQELRFDPSGDVPAHTLKSNYGAAFEWGKTFFFNGRRPVAGMIRFGLDWSWVDWQYASFSVGGTDENGAQTEQSGHFINMGMQLGPSVTVTPVRNLHARLYAHYAPSTAGFAPQSLDDIKLGYAGYVTGGLHLSYRFVTLGVELRSGTAKFSTINTGALDDIGGDFEEDGEDGGSIDNPLDDMVGPKVKTKLPATRFTLGFRF